MCLSVTRNEVTKGRLCRNGSDPFCNVIATFDKRTNKQEKYSCAVFICILFFIIYCKNFVNCTVTATWSCLFNSFLFIPPYVILNTTPHKSGCKLQHILSWYLQTHCHKIYLAAILFDYLACTFNLFKSHLFNIYFFFFFNNNTASDNRFFFSFDCRGDSKIFNDSKRTICKFNNFEILYYFLRCYISKNIATCVVLMQNALFAIQIKW
jgi:hypothetical protein